MISNVKGSFLKIAGALTLDESDLTKSTVEATIDVASIDTRDAQRDGHLKSADFFDVEKYPAMNFKSTKLTVTGSEEGTVEGDLTIRDVTRPVVFKVEGPTPQTKDPWGNLRIGASATTKISRKEFGLTWNAGLEAGGVMIGDEVAITLEVEFVKAA
jgi:polyisoprenoid-binding protein YceI